MYLAHDQSNTLQILSDWKLIIFIGILLSIDVILLGSNEYLNRYKWAFQSAKSTLNVVKICSLIRALGLLFLSLLFSFSIQVHAKALMLPWLSELWFKNWSSKTSSNTLKNQDQPTRNPEGIQIHQNIDTDRSNISHPRITTTRSMIPPMCMGWLCVSLIQSQLVERTRFPGSLLPLSFTR